MSTNTIFNIGDLSNLSPFLLLQIQQLQQQQQHQAAIPLPGFDITNWGNPISTGAAAPVPAPAPAPITTTTTTTATTKAIATNKSSNNNNSNNNTRATSPTNNSILYYDAVDDEDDHDHDNNEKSGKNSKKRVAACEACRKVHRKCDGKHPCAQCIQRGIQCVYPEPKKRGPVRGLNKQLKDQIARLEAEIRRLKLNQQQQQQKQSSIQLMSMSGDARRSLIPMGALVASPMLGSRLYSTQKVTNLLEIYFKFISKCCPIITRKTIEPQLQAVLSGIYDDDFLADLPGQFIFNGVLALSAQRVGDRPAANEFHHQTKLVAGKLFDTAVYEVGIGFALLALFNLGEGVNSAASMNLKLASNIVKILGGRTKNSNLHKTVLVAGLMCCPCLPRKRKMVSQIVSRYYDHKDPRTRKYRYYYDIEENGGDIYDTKAIADGSSQVSSCDDDDMGDVTLGLEKVMAEMSLLVKELLVEGGAEGVGHCGLNSIKIDTTAPKKGDADYMHYLNKLQDAENYVNAQFDADEVPLLQATIQIWAARALVLKMANLKSMSIEWANKTTMLTRNSKFTLSCPSILYSIRQVINIHMEHSCLKELEEDYIALSTLARSFPVSKAMKESMRDQMLDKFGTHFVDFFAKQDEEDQTEEQRFAEAAKEAHPPSPQSDLLVQRLTGGAPPLPKPVSPLEAASKTLYYSANANANANAITGSSSSKNSSHKRQRIVDIVDDDDDSNDANRTNSPATTTPPQQQQQQQFTHNTNGLDNTQLPPTPNTSTAMLSAMGFGGFLEGMGIVPTDFPDFPAVSTPPPQHSSSDNNDYQASVAAELDELFGSIDAIVGDDINMVTAYNL